MGRRAADPDVVEWLADQLRAGPRPVSEIDIAARQSIANRSDLLRAALALGVKMYGSAANRTWQL